MDPISLDAMAAAVPDGASIAMPPDNSLPAVALAKALIRRGARGLRLLGVPVSGFATDILIGAGCVAEVQTSAARLGEAGFAPRFSAAVRDGSLRVLDATCPAIHTMLQASEKGVPFMPLRGLIGSDILAHRPDWRVVPNPFSAEGEDPDPAAAGASPGLRRLPRRDGGSAGQCLAGPPAGMRDHRPCQRAASRDGGAGGGGQFPRGRAPRPRHHHATYVTAVAVAERGAHPVALLDEYGGDSAYVADYARMARTAMPASAPGWSARC